MSMDEFTSDEIAKDFHKAAQVKSFGLLIREDEKGVTLGTDEGTNDGAFRKVIFIPRGMIVEKIDLGVPKRPRTKRTAKVAPDHVSTS